jgi:hypothetical protein
VFDLIVFAFEVFKNGGLLYNIVGELLPFHVSVAIDIDLIEEVRQIPH